MNRVLVAGIGNVFLGDDGFGVAVANRFAREELPPEVRVVDYGIRSVHLAFELFDAPDLLVLVDATARGGAPGTLYVIEPDQDDIDRAVQGADAHAMDPVAVLGTVKRVTGSLPRTRIVGCEPAVIDEGMELSKPVEAAIEPAIAMIRRLVEKERST